MLGKPREDRGQGIEWDTGFVAELGVFVAVRAPQIAVLGRFDDDFRSGNHSFTRV
jgi:hypothetical protein